MGRERQFDALTSGQSIGLQRRLASAALERPLWRFRRRARTTGYVCSTLQPVVGGAIFLMLERQEVGRECEFAD
jgi:hypothetical protein